MLNFLKIIFIISIVLGVCFLVLEHTSYIWVINQARRKGIYPSRGKITLEDIKRLLQMGEKTLAIYAYREMYHLSLKQAKLEVEQLQRHMLK